MDDINDIKKDIPQLNIEIGDMVQLIQMIIFKVLLVKQYYQIIY